MRGRKATRVRARVPKPVEIFYHDAKTWYDAPIDLLWKFMEDEEFHAGAHHATLRNFHGKELSPTSFEAVYETRNRGKWGKYRSRHTRYPPLCKVDEHLEGDYAGTVTLYHYWPEGKRTRLEIWACLRSPTLSARELRAHWRESWAQAYREDNAVLPKFLKAHRKHSAE